MKNRMKGALIAASVASLFSCQSEPKKNFTNPNPKIQCGGINECKGKSDCHALDGSHTCGTLNECKGKGWLSLTEKDCKEKGGTVVAKK